MPPSSGALLETHYTGLNILLALAHNTSATGPSHENFAQQWDFSSGKMNNYHITRKNTETNVHAIYLFIYCKTLCGICKDLSGLTALFIKSFPPPFSFFVEVCHYAVKLNVTVKAELEVNTVMCSNVRSTYNFWWKCDEGALLRYHVTKNVGNYCSYTGARLWKWTEKTLE